MRLMLGLAACFAVLCCVEVLAQEPQVAREGRGLLPPPAAMPAALGGTPPLHPFVSDPSGGFSRTIFESDEDPNFKIIIRDFSFPPNGKKHTITVPSAAFLQILGRQGYISLANRRQPFNAAERTAVPAGAPLDVVNNGKQHLVVRALIVEAK